MGAMACRRDGCDASCCDHLIMDRWYLCNSCFAELLEVKKLWPDEMTENQIVEHLETFRDSNVRAVRVLSGEALETRISQMLGLDRDT